MIITEKVTVTITNSNIKHYSKYNVKIYDKIQISINELSSGSSIKVLVKCDVCDTEKTIIYKSYNRNIKKWNLYCCSNKCAQIKNKLTNKLLYGDENYNNLQQYKQTCLQKYNTDSYSKTDEFKEKYTKTCLKNHNVENSFQLITKDDNIKKWLAKRYKLYSKYNIINIDNENKIYTFKCDNNQEHNFDIPFDLFQNRKSDNSKLCTVCFKPNESNKSSKEVELQLWIKSIYNGEIIINSRKIIYPFELDILLPEINLAFEFNGNFWHSELKKDKYYHFNKFNKCKDNNIDLISIWEWVWDENKDLIKQKIYNTIFNINNLNYTDDIIKLERNWKIDKLLTNYTLIEETEPEVINEYKKYNIFNSGYWIFKKINL